MKKSVLLVLVFTCIAACSYAQATFAPVINYPISGSFADHVTAGDFNHDGKTDIAVATNTGSYQVLVYYQNPLTGALDTPAVPYNYPTAYPGVRAIASGDINNDGRDDIAIAYQDTIGIYYQGASGTMNPLVSMWCSAGDVAVIKIADVDMDGLTDIVAVPQNTSSDVVVYYGIAGGGFTQINYPTAYTGSYLDDLRVGKVGSDTLNSLVRMSGNVLDPITRLRIRTDRTLDTTIIHSVPPGTFFGTHGVEIGRFTDTSANQVVATYGGNVPFAYLALWRHPDTAYLSDTVIAVSDVPQPLAAGHLGCSPTSQEQLVILHGGWNKVSVVDFIFGIVDITTPCPNNAAHDAVVIADVNGDGRKDIVMVNTFAGLSVLLNTTTPTTDTSIVAGHTTTFDSSLVSHVSSVVFDTTAITGGIVITKDSTFAGVYNFMAITTNDSGRLVINGCSGDTTSYTSYLHSLDTVTVTHFDTIRTITRDTLFNTEVRFVSGANIKMYPNPFTKGITIEAQGKFFATIYTAVGQVIETRAWEDRLTFNGASLPPGIYILVVEDGNHSTLCRSPIIKQ